MYKYANEQNEIGQYMQKAALFAITRILHSPLYDPQHKPTPRDNHTCYVSQLIPVTRHSVEGVMAMSSPVDQMDVE